MRCLKHSSRRSSMSFFDAVLTKALTARFGCVGCVGERRQHIVFRLPPHCFRRITGLPSPKIRCCVPTFSGLFWGWAHRRHCRRYWQSRPVAQQLLVCLHACWVQRQDWHICQDQPPIPRRTRSALLIAEPPATHHAWPLPRAARQRRNRHRKRHTKSPATNSQ